jgi:N-acetylglucosaminyldiphosphoundecaprenol N-acetyl-beta-D-mannosaminyltransferase
MKVIYYKLRKMKKRQSIRKKVKRETANFDLKYWKMFGMSFFGSRSYRLLKILSEKRKTLGTKIWVTTVNSEFIMAAKADNKFADIIAKSDIRVVDGIGLIWAKEVLKSSKGFKRWYRALVIGLEILGGKRREEVISGSDLIVELSKVASKKKQKIFLLGGWKNRAEETGKFLSKKYHGLKYDFCSGEPELRNEEVIKKINKSKADYLFVAYGMRRQEEWIMANLAKLEVKVVIGVGRSFDYYSGALKRAPMWVRKMGFEWLYSLVKEPKRWKRQLVLPKFILMVLTEVS